MTVHDIAPEDALASLRTAARARAAARRPDPWPGWYPVTAAGLFGAGFTAIGLSVLLPQRLRLPAALLQLVAALLLVGHVVVSHRIEHRPGIVPTPAYPAAAAHLLPPAAAGALALLFGPAGFLLTLGVTGGLTHLLVLHRERARADAS
ncbi:hypothetical protein [Streptomyces sp. CBMA123]|uniref:hypothetical protein n=1 Tax=Streptomyces sp. CBMA123 TaxID=1896313 RepID=UPI001661C9A5|nr:hypothetical protein [Streptomyces sp. CBMA123]